MMLGWVVVVGLLFSLCSACEDSPKLIQMTHEDRALLCNGFKKGDTSPIACYKSVVHSFGHKSSILACSSSKTPEMVAKCAQALVSQHDINVVKDFCRGMTSETPLRCIKELRRLGFGFVQVSSLCAENQLNKYDKAVAGEPLGVVQCFNGAKGHGFSTLEAVEICKQRNSLVPLDCALRARSNRGLSFKGIARICADSDYASAGKCGAECIVDALKPINIGDGLCIRLCRNATSSGPATCLARALSKSSLKNLFATISLPQGFDTLVTYIGTLCNEADSSAPVECLTQVTLTNKNVPLLQRINLCAQIKQHESIVGRIRCLRVAPQQLSIAENIKLCNGTITGDVLPISKDEIGPAVCAKELFRTQFPMQKEDVVKFCRAHSSYSRDANDGKSRARCMMPLKALLQKGNKNMEPVKQAAMHICRTMDWENNDYVTSPVACLVDTSNFLNKFFKRSLDGETNEVTDDLFKLCQNAQDSGPAACVTTLMKRSNLDFPTSSRLCASNPVISLCCVHALQSTLSKRDFASLASHKDALPKLCLNLDQEHCTRPSDCIIQAFNSKAIGRFPLGVYVNMCSSATSSFPIKCALLLKKRYPHMTEDAILAACTWKNHRTHVIETGPLHCLLLAKSLLKIPCIRNDEDFVLSLCRDAEHGAEPVLCVEDYFSISKVPRVNVLAPNLKSALIELCQHAANATQVVDCIGNAPSSLQGRNVYNTERLCSGRNVEGALVCAEQLVREFEDRRIPLNIDLVVGVCRNATDAIPAKCVSNLLWTDKDKHMAQTFLNLRHSTKNIIRLCEQASTEAGHEHCLGVLSKIRPQLSMEAMLTLCSTRGGEPEVTAQCVLRASKRNKGMSEEGIMSLCIRATSYAPGKCAELTPGSLSEADTINLCKGCKEGDSMFPTQCLASAMTLQWGDTEESQQLLSILCRGTKSKANAPVKCVRKIMATEALVQKHDSSSICSGAQSNAPAECFFSLQHSKVLQMKHIVELCQGRDSRVVYGPEHCVADISTSFKPFEAGLLSSLCRSATSNVTSACFLSAPASLTTLEKHELCIGATTLYPVSCVSNFKLARSMSSAQRVRLCRHSVSTGPEICAVDLQGVASASTRVKLCKEIEGDTPQKCMRHLMSSRAFPHEYDILNRDVEYCRNAVSVPFKIFLSKTESLIEMVTQPVKAGVQLSSPLEVEIHDQFDFLIEPPKSLRKILVVLRASHDESHLDWGTLSGVPQIELDQLDGTGPFVFDNLTIFDTSGEIEIVIMAVGTKIESYILPLVVERDFADYMKQMSRCDSILAKVQCGLDAKFTEFRKIVPFPWNLQACSTACANTLASMGMSIVCRNGQVFGDVEAGPARLLSNIQIPTVDTDPYEVLQVGRNASKSEIRGAYHKASLAWHPDRWARFHPKLQAKAAGIFSVVRHAHLSLLANLEKAEQDTVCTDGY